MAERTAIGWTDHTFNPWLGCCKVSPGCQNCYALPIATRAGLDVWGPPSTTSRQVTSEAYWRTPIRWNRQARDAGRQHRVFCASMADVFEDHPDVRDARDRLWSLIAETEQLDWQLLTKRPENIGQMVPTNWTHTWPSHVWIGTSVEDQARAGERIPRLLDVPAAIRFLSCEPLIGPLTLHPYLGELQWVIVGGESGPRRRPMELDWLTDIVDQCESADLPVFVKQDSALYPERQGRIPDVLWALKEVPVHHVAATT